MFCNRLSSDLQNDVHRQSVTSPSLFDSKKYYEDMFNTPKHDVPEETPPVPTPVPTPQEEQTPGSIKVLSNLYDCLHYRFKSEGIPDEL